MNKQEIVQNRWKLINRLFILLVVSVLVILIAREWQIFNSNIDYFNDNLYTSAKHKMMMKTAIAQTPNAAMLNTPTSLKIFEGKPKIPEPTTPLITSSTMAHLLILRFSIGKR